MKKNNTYSTDTVITQKSALKACNSQKQFVISDETAALLSLCVEIDRVVMRIEEESEDITNSLYGVRSLVGKMVYDRMEWMLAQLGNICQEKITL